MSIYQCHEDDGEDPFVNVVLASVGVLLDPWGFLLASLSDYLGNLVVGYYELVGKSLVGLSCGHIPQGDGSLMQLEWTS